MRNVGFRGDSMCQLPATQTLMATNDRLPADELELSTKKRKLGIPKTEVGDACRRHANYRKEYRQVVTVMLSTFSDLKRSALR